MEIHYKFLVMRKTLGYNQVELATRLGVTKNTIVNWEKGHTELPARVWVALYEEYKSKKGGVANHL